MKSFVLTTQESELNTRVLIDRIACHFELGNSLINLRETVHLSLVLLISVEVCCIYLFNVLRWKNPVCLHELFIYR